MIAPVLVSLNAMGKICRYQKYKPRQSANDVPNRDN